MRVRSIVVLLLAVAVLAGAVACNGDKQQAAQPTPTATPTAQEVWVTEEDSGGSVTVNVGDSLIVALDSNPTTGFEWALVNISDTSVIQKVHDEYIAPEPTSSPLVGQPGEELWTFQPLKAGSATIEMMYARPWESVPPAQRFNISVTLPSSNYDYSVGHPSSLSQELRYLFNGLIEHSPLLGVICVPRTRMKNRQHRNSVARTDMNGAAALCNAPNSRHSHKRRTTHRHYQSGFDYFDLSV